MYRKSASALLTVLLAVAGVSTLAWGQPIERSGNVFHRQVCPGPDRPGVARCHAHVVTDSKGNAVERSAAPNLTIFGYHAADLQGAYNISATGGNAGTVIAIVDAYGYNNAESDLAVYRSSMKLPACTSTSACFTKLNQSGHPNNYPPQNTGWAQETALDLDMASAMCPYCHIVLVEADSASYANLAAAENTAASQPGVHAISNSYGGGETGTAGYETSYNHPGIAITVSTGDSGYGVQFPATSPHVTAVGGTSLSLSGGRSETAWSGTGSGCSTVYPKQPWQHDSGCNMRMEADVSAVADPATGVAVYAPSSRRGSSWQVYGGTSVAAPLTAGIYGSNGTAVTYGSNPYSTLGALNDVTSGSNGKCGTAYFCNAGTGYDGPTGLGTPNGNQAF